MGKAQPSLTEEHKATVQADQFVRAQCKEVIEDFRRLLQGASHSVNRCNAEYADCWKAVEELRAKVDLQAQELSEANAAIAKLQEQVQGARKAYSELKKAIGQPPGA